MYADTAELAALCEVVAEIGGFYAPHTRSYGAGALEAYAEMIELARNTRCPLHLTHATMNFSVNRGRAQEFLDMVDAGIADGCDITLDTYPYLPGSTTLSALLPSWAMSGGPDAALERIQDPDIRTRITEDVNVNGSDGCHGVTVEWDTIQISGVANGDLDSYVGRTVQTIAADRGIAPVEVFFDLLTRDQLATTILQHVGHEENVRAIMVHPKHMGGSDAILVEARPHPEDIEHLSGLPHSLRPRDRPVEAGGVRRPSDRWYCGSTARSPTESRSDRYAADLVILEPTMMLPTPPRSGTRTAGAQIEPCS